MKIRKITLNGLLITAYIINFIIIIKYFVNKYKIIL